MYSRRISFISLFFLPRSIPWSVNEGTSFWTRTEVVVTSHCFEHFLTVITITVHIKTVNFLLFSRCELALNFAFWSCFPIERHHHILKATRSVLFTFKLLHIVVKLPSLVQSCWHILTHWKKVKLACINSNDWFAYIWWVSDECFINYIFSSQKMEGLPATVMSSLIFSQFFITFAKCIKLVNCRFV